MLIFLGMILPAIFGKSLSLPLVFVCFPDNIIYMIQIPASFLAGAGFIFNQTPPCLGLKGFVVFAEGFM
jgi:hypothetical protein